MLRAAGLQKRWVFSDSSRLPSKTTSLSEVPEVEITSDGVGYHEIFRFMPFEYVLLQHALLRGSLEADKVIPASYSAVRHIWRE